MVNKIRRVHDGDVLPPISKKEVYAALHCRTEASQSMIKDKSTTKNQTTEVEKNQETQVEEQNNETQE